MRNPEHERSSRSARARCQASLPSIRGPSGPRRGGLCASGGALTRARSGLPSRAPEQLRGRVDEGCPHAGTESAADCDHPRPARWVPLAGGGAPSLPRASQTQRAASPAVAGRRFARRQGVGRTAQPVGRAARPPRAAVETTRPHPPPGEGSPQMRTACAWRATGASRKCAVLPIPRSLVRIPSSPSGLCAAPPDSVPLCRPRTALSDPGQPDLAGRRRDVEVVAGGTRQLSAGDPPRSDGVKECHIGRVR